MATELGAQVAQNASVVEPISEPRSDARIVDSDIAIDVRRIRARKQFRAEAKHLWRVRRELQNPHPCPLPDYWEREIREDAL